MRPEPLTCQLCGVEDHHVTERLIAWADTETHQPYDLVARCDDDVTCRQRVEALGETWPVRERTRVAR